ncbi:Superfamily II DNA/RNA helicases, SNF2 family, partial [mine drainage metagenome]
MSALEHDFAAGALVRARGREWVVQSDSRRDWLRLRPLGGADDDSIALTPRAWSCRPIAARHPSPG